VVLVASTSIRWYTIYTLLQKPSNPREHIIVNCWFWRRLSLWIIRI